MVFKAKMRNIRQTPRKAGEVAALIRRRSIDDALVILQHTPRRVALVFIKLLKNAQAAARDNHRLKAKSLHLDEIFVVAGPILKRHRRNAKLTTSNRVANRNGSGAIIVPWDKRSSHIFMTVSGEVSASSKPTVKSSPSEEKKKELGDGSKS